MSVASRAVMVAAILYGVLLQAFVAAATPVIAAEPGILCSHDAGGRAPDGGTPRHDHHQCCIAAHPGTFGPPLWPAASLLPARSPILLAAAPPPESPPQERPPTHAVSARGPPPV